MYRCNSCISYFDRLYILLCIHFIYLYLIVQLFAKTMFSWRNYISYNIKNHHVIVFFFDVYLWYEGSRNTKNYKKLQNKMSYRSFCLKTLMFFVTTAFLALVSHKNDSIVGVIHRGSKALRQSLFLTLHVTCVTICELGIVLFYVQFLTIWR